MNSSNNLKQLIDQAIQKSENLFKSNRYKEAELLLKQTLKVDVNNTKALQLLGLSYHKLQKYNEAIFVFNRILKEEENAETYNNLSLCYVCINQADKAIETIKKAIELEPNKHIYYSNLSLHYAAKRELDKAVESIQKSISLKKDDPTIWANLGSIYGQKKELNKAIECFEKAIELDPSNIMSHVDLAYSHHLLENWELAWPEYEYRLDCFQQIEYFKKIYDWNRLLKQSQCVNGKKIAVFCEQGSGDLIQFARFLPDLKQRGATVLLQASDDISPIIRHLADDITPSPIQNYDYCCSILSLPYLLNISPKEYNRGAYIASSTNHKLQSKDMNIGITWAGNPRHPNDANRSMYLKFFKKIHDLNNVKLHCLQKDLRPRIYSNDPKQIDLMEDCDGMTLIKHPINTFEDTIAAIDETDLVITVDTAILHLAGAMGKKTWGLLAYNPDWRWGITGNKTIWYDSVTLFRQPSYGDWQSVLNSVVEQLLNENTRLSAGV